MGDHLDEVDDTGEVPFGTDRELHDQRGGLQPIQDGVDRGKEICPDPVHLVDETDPGNLIPVGLPPHRFRLGFDAGDRIEDGHSAVEYSKRPLDFDGEVDVARRVDDVDPMLVPLAGRGGRGDGDAALLFLLHPVHDGTAFVDFAELVGATGVIQNAFGQRRFTRVDVGHDPDVAGTAQRVLTQVRQRVVSVCHLCVSCVPGAPFGA